MNSMRANRRSCQQAGFSTAVRAGLKSEGFAKRCLDRGIDVGMECDGQLCRSGPPLQTEAAFVSEGHAVYNEARRGSGLLWRHRGQRQEAAQEEDGATVAAQQKMRARLTWNETDGMQ